MTFKSKAALVAEPLVAPEKPVSTKWTAKQKAAFLAHLAVTSNVSDAARTAEVPVRSAYALRRKEPAFRDEWHDALCEGYARLEAELLAAALIGPNGNTKDATLKSRAQKYRLGVTLLSAHRATVRGGIKPVLQKDGAVSVRARLEHRFIIMREQMTGGTDG
ncbi:MAG: hypothetical protein RLZZ366_950 [Pseudomonadota bacterium]|jgi:hypothetical protein